MTETRTGDRNVSKNIGPVEFQGTPEPDALKACRNCGKDHADGPDGWCLECCGQSRPAEDRKADEGLRQGIAIMDRASNALRDRFPELLGRDDKAAEYVDGGRKVPLWKLYVVTDERNQAIAERDALRAQITGMTEANGWIRLDSDQADIADRLKDLENDLKSCQFNYDELAAQIERLTSDEAVEAAESGYNEWAVRKHHTLCGNDGIKAAITEALRVAGEVGSTTEPNQ